MTYRLLQSAVMGYPLLEKRGTLSTFLKSTPVTLSKVSVSLARQNRRWAGSKQGFNLGRGPQTRCFSQFSEAKRGRRFFISKSRYVTLDSLFALVPRSLATRSL